MADEMRSMFDEFSAKLREEIALERNQERKRLAIIEERLAAAEKGKTATEDRLVATEERLAAAERRVAATEERLIDAEAESVIATEGLTAAKETVQGMKQEISKLKDGNNLLLRRVLRDDALIKLKAEFGVPSSVWPTKGPAVTALVEEVWSIIGPHVGDRLRKDDLRLVLDVDSPLS